VAAAWQAGYEFDSPVGVVLQTDAQGNRKYTPISAQQFPRWVPSRARFIVRGRYDSSSPLVPQAITGKAIEGRNDYLDITFPRNRERVQAKLVRISDQADVALVKIDMPRPLQKLEMLDNYDSIAQGDEISVLGYPGVSPMVVGAIQSKEAITPSTEMNMIPDKTRDPWQSGPYGNIHVDLWRRVSADCQLHRFRQQRWTGHGPQRESDRPVHLRHSNGRTHHLRRAHPIRHGVDGHQASDVIPWA
jgi:hypothetical protein